MPVLDIAGQQQNVNMFGAYQQGKAMRIAEENEARKMQMEEERLALTERQVATQEGRLKYDQDRLQQGIAEQRQKDAQEQANKMFEDEVHRAAMQGYLERIANGDPDADAERDEYVKNNFPDFYELNKDQFAGHVTTPEEAQKGYDQIDYINKKLAKGSSVSASLQELNIRNDIEKRAEAAGGWERAVADGTISDAEKAFYDAGFGGATAAIQNAEAILKIMADPDLPQEYKDAMVKSLGGYIDQGGKVKISEELAMDIADQMIESEMEGLAGFDEWFGTNETAQKLLAIEIMQRLNNGESMEEARQGAIASVQRQLGRPTNQGGNNPPPEEGAVAEPQTQEEFDALPPGTRYKDPDDGKVYTKK